MVRRTIHCSVHVSPAWCLPDCTHTRPELERASLISSCIGFVPVHLALNTSKPWACSMNVSVATCHWLPHADTFFCVVDLHAITMPHDPKALRESSHATAAAYIAAGVDPSKSSIFMQSHVAGHSELTWLLGCYTPIGWLERMIQFKVRTLLLRRGGFCITGARQKNLPACHSKHGCHSSGPSAVCPACVGAQTAQTAD